ncbi:hypothetical protein DL771_003500 [Monosporascus sp. 5C6A]|nr:hypothetical protein DL771_003500 [Monosporascus sp. 5C6A]
MAQNAHSLRGVLQQDVLPPERLQMRSATKEQGNREQIEAGQAMVREGHVPAAGLPGRRRDQLLELDPGRPVRKDFTVAVVKSRETRYRSYVQHSHPEGSLIMGKDVVGDYRTCGYRLKGTWAEIERESEKIVAEAQPPALA